MAHVNARKTPEVIPGLWGVDKRVLDRVAELIAEDHAIEVVAAKVNVDYEYGTLPGIPNPRVGSDGVVYDPDRMRRYSIAEISAVAALPECVELAEQKRAKAVLEAKQDARDAKVEQLAQARLMKAALHDQRAVPTLYGEVLELRRLVRYLLVCADKQIGVPRLQGRPVWTLPEAPHENGELTH